MRRTFERDTKARLSFSGGPHAPVNMVDSQKKWMSVEKNAGNGTFGTLYKATEICIFARTVTQCGMTNSNSSGYW